MTGPWLAALVEMLDETNDTRVRSHPAAEWPLSSRLSPEVVMR